MYLFTADRKRVGLLLVLLLPLVAQAGCGRAAAEQAAFKRVRQAGGTINIGNGIRISFRLSKITDDDLACLEGLHRVRELDLYATEISDAAIEHILKIQQLDVINLNRTNISNDGKNRLKEKFPEITFSPK